MKKLKYLLPLLFVIIFIVICIFPFTFEAPDDLNLEFWVTDCVNTDIFENYEEGIKFDFLPFRYVNDIYLGKDYKTINTDEGVVYPERYVCYEVGPYPDYACNNKYIVGIFITDPDVQIYGINVNSPIDDFINALKNENYKITINENSILAKKYRISIYYYFLENKIYIATSVTNFRHLK